MFENHVSSRLAGKLAVSAVVRRMLRVAGMGESAATKRLLPSTLSIESQTTILFNQSRD